MAWLNDCVRRACRYRLHQFSKVELFAVTDEQRSDDMLREMVELQCAMHEALGLHLRVLHMPTGELGASAYQKYDLEAWLPGRQAWGEVCSASNCTAYQAGRLPGRVRYRPPPGSAARGKPKPVVAHTLNATALAVPRVIIALLETHQRRDGSVDIPAALQPFMGGQRVLRPRE